MKYKAIVSDFDGTLVDDSLSIHEPVKKAIKTYLKEGGVFSIATGRSYYGAIKDICIELKIDWLHISRGGSEIISSKTHEVIWGKYINPTMLETLLQFLHSKKNIYFTAESGKKIFTKGGFPDPRFDPKVEVADLAEITLGSVAKVTLPASKNDPQIVLALLDELSKKFPTLHIIKTSHKHFIGIDITDGGVSKHLALLEYAQLMNLSPEEIIGVGDSYNDYPLLSACGYKVAMGNAPEELAQIADKIVGTQEDDGILEVFELFNN